MAQDTAVPGGRDQTPEHLLRRKQQQQQTRARLIETAGRMFAAGGVTGVSLRRLCEDAGYSQGAFYSNFDSKDDLLRAVVERHILQQAAALDSLLQQSAGSDLDTALERIAGHLAALEEIPDWSLLSIELQLHARRDPGFAARSVAVRTAVLDSFAQVLARLVSDHGLHPVMDPPELARALYALWSGLALQGSGTEGEEGGEPRGAVMLVFLRQMTGVAGPGGGRPERDCADLSE